MSIHRSLCAVLLLAGACVVPTAQSDLLPVPAFNGTGKVLTALPGGLQAEARAVLAQRDGSVVVAGNTSTGRNDANADFLLLRYRPDGALDDGFGTHGAVVTPLGPSRDIAYALLQQPDGKLVVIGGSEGGGAQGSIAVARYLPDGSPDRQFNGSGTVVTTINIGNVAAFAGSLQADGKILAAGHDNAHGFVVVRYLPNGLLDTAFGKSGVVLVKPGLRAWANAMAVQADGRIVLAGHSDDGGVISLLRLLPDGSLDPSFGQGGVVSTEAGLQRSSASGLALLADGSLLVAGTTRLDNNSPQQMIVLRYLPDGALDERFGTGGAALVPAAASSVARAIAVQADGSALLAGFQQTAKEQRDPVVAVLQADGAVTSRQVLPGDSSAMFTAAAPRADGSAVLAGSEGVRALVTVLD